MRQLSRLRYSPCCSSSPRQPFRRRRQPRCTPSQLVRPTAASPKTTSCRAATAICMALGVSYGANGTGDVEPVYAPLQATDGNFYGTTGFFPFSCGNLYQLTPAGVYKNLHTFSGSDCGPASGLLQASDGSLYGTLFSCLLNGSGPGACTRSARDAFSKKFTASRHHPGRLHVLV
jgi:hypothetical protein